MTGAGRSSGCASDGDRIVDADADGLDTGVRGLSLLEAAAVGGRDAGGGRAGERDRARLPSRAVADRVAVAMSGGVDSAVALLRAGPDAIGVTLRLWIDPQGTRPRRLAARPPL